MNRKTGINYSDDGFIQSSFRCVVCRPGLGAVYAAVPSGVTAALPGVFALQ